MKGWGLLGFVVACVLRSPLLPLLPLVILQSVRAEEPEQSLSPPPAPSTSPESNPSHQFAVLYDLGSTGTRVHIHAVEWLPHECAGGGAVNVLMPGWSEKVKPGLALLVQQRPWDSQVHQQAHTGEDTVDSRTHGSAENGCRVDAAGEWLTGEEEERAHCDRIEKSLEGYMGPLEAFVKAHLTPAHLQRTAILMRATGGFRYLSAGEQERSLNVLYRIARRQFPQTFLKRENLRVITGVEEGAFSWLALNQLGRRFFDRLEHVSVHPDWRDAFLDGAAPLHKKGEGVREGMREGVGEGVEEGGEEDEGLNDMYADKGRKKDSDDWRAEAARTAKRRVKDRVGLVEVGGASAQVALEPPKRRRAELLSSLSPDFLAAQQPPLTPHPSKPGVHILKFCRENFPLRLYALDGFGRQAALQLFLRHQARQQQSDEKLGLAPGATFEAACLPPDVTIPLSLPAPRKRAKGADSDSDSESESESEMEISIDINENSDTKLLGSHVFAKGSSAHGAADVCRASLQDFLKDWPSVARLASGSSERGATEARNGGGKYGGTENATSLKNTTNLAELTIAETDANSDVWEIEENYRFYATENFYYFNRYVAQSTDSRLFSADDWLFKAQSICGQEVAVLEAQLGKETAREKYGGACFGLIFMSELLTSVIKIPQTQILKAVTAVKQLDTGFVLGSILAELPEVLKDRDMAASVAGGGTNAPGRRTEGGWGAESTLAAAEREATAELEAATEAKRRAVEREALAKEALAALKADKPVARIRDEF